MKQIICGLFVLVLLSPNLVSAITVEEQFRSVLKQFIAILELRQSQLQQMLAQQDQSMFRIATTQSLTGFATTTSSKRRGSGGNNRPRNDIPTTTPIVRSPFILSGNLNTLSVAAEETYVLSKITVNPVDFPDAVSRPDLLVLRADLLPVDSFEILLPYNLETGLYESEDLSGYLNEGESWRGIYTVLVPIEIINYQFSYKMELNIDEKLYDETLVNPGLPEAEIVTNAIRVSDIGYTVDGGADNVALWPIDINNLGEGLMLIDTMVFNLQMIGPLAIASELFSDMRIVDGNGRSFPGTLEDSRIVFSNLNLEIEGQSSLSFNLIADFQPRNENASFLISFDTAEIIAYDAFGQAYELPVGYFENDIINLIQLGLQLQADSFLAETQWLGADDTVGEFILTFTLEANGQDYYIRSEAALVGDSNETGLDYVLNGDYGSGAAIVSLQIESQEVSPGVHVVRSGGVAKVILTLEITTSQESDFSVGLRELWYSRNTNGVTDAEVIEFAPGEFETELLFLRPVSNN